MHITYADTNNNYYSADMRCQHSYSGHSLDSPEAVSKATATRSYMGFLCCHNDALSIRVYKPAFHKGKTLNDGRKADRGLVRKKFLTTLDTDLI